MIGGALDEESVLLIGSSTKELNDSAEFVGLESNNDSNNKDEEDDDDDGNEDEILAQSKLRDMAKSTTGKTPQPTMTRMTSAHLLVTREFLSSTFSKKRNQKKLNKKEVQMRMMTTTIA